MTNRREIVTMLATMGLVPAVLREGTSPLRQPSRPPMFRVRTITAGISVRDAADLRPFVAALDVLERSRRAFTDAGYEVQTIRLATNPFLASATQAERSRALKSLELLDQLVASRNAIISLGPVQAVDAPDRDLAPWAGELIQRTHRISFSTVIASPELGVHRHSLLSAAEIMVALSRAIPGGMGNFRFAAAANIPAGTPFFPVAHHQGPESLALGLESPRLLQETFAGAQNVSDGERRLRAALAAAYQPVQRLGRDIARRESRAYLGIDLSPAPGMDSSIAGAIEALTHVPFGAASTLEACAAITSALKNTGLDSCGYSGLMLPVLEDPVLARRANERRYSLKELLLYSSVCGTGLDVVPIAGDTPPETLARLIGDVAALSARLHKPLSARLFLVPGKGVGDMAHFEDPLLTDSVVFPID
jgi:uncharacterized protein (UPF0210 family)